MLLRRARAAYSFRIAPHLENVMLVSRRSLFGLVVAAASLAAAHAAFANDWPTKPVTIVVGYPAGGDTDAAARLYAERLAEKFGQPFLVDNRAGAGGTIAAAFVAKAKPDGYVLLYTPINFAIVPHVLRQPSVTAQDVRNAFTPIIKDQNIPLVMVAGGSSGIRSLGDMVQQAKAGKIQSYASPSTGSVMHVLAETFNRAAGLTLAHVPYKGSAPMVADLIGGHVAVGWATPGVIAAHVHSGKLVALATGESRRSPLLPDTPTLAESGYPSAKLSAWQGLLGPKGLPPAIVGQLNTTLNGILLRPDVAARLRAMGMEPVGGPPEALAAQIEADSALFARLIKEYDIRAE